MAECTHPTAVIRILVADGHDDTRSLYRESLGRMGWEVTEVADGRDALVEALSHPPALIITETALPKVDGFALCDVLRHDSVTRGVPILVATAEARPAALARARAAGADAVLVKPIPPDVLLREVRRLIGAGATAAVDCPRSERRLKPAIDAYVRVETATPPISPPSLHCPSCSRPLKYGRSHIGGVGEWPREQWDEYTCTGACGTFEYRQRTRELRRLETHRGVS